MWHGIIPNAAAAKEQDDDLAALCSAVAATRGCNDLLRHALWMRMCDGRVS